MQSHSHSQYAAVPLPQHPHPPPPPHHPPSYHHPHPHSFASLQNGAAFPQHQSSPLPGTIPGQNGMMRFGAPLETGPMAMAGARHKKDIKRRTKTGCLTCRKRRIKVSAAHHLPFISVRWSLLRPIDKIPCARLIYAYATAGAVASEESKTYATFHKHHSSSLIVVRTLSHTPVHTLY